MMQQRLTKIALMLAHQNILDSLKLDKFKYFTKKIEERRRIYLCSCETFISYEFDILMVLELNSIFLNQHIPVAPLPPPLPPLRTFQRLWTSTRCTERLRNGIGNAWSSRCGRGWSKSIVADARIRTPLDPLDLSSADSSLFWFRPAFRHGIDSAGKDREKLEHLSPTEHLFPGSRRER